MQAVKSMEKGKVFRLKSLGCVLGVLLFVLILLEPTYVCAEDTWTSETVLESEWESGYGSIVLDSNDSPHIVFSCDDYLQYAYWTGSNWNVETVDNKTYCIERSSLAIDSKGNPHIAYIKYGYMVYASWDGLKWNFEDVFGLGEGTSAKYISLAIDHGDNPYIAYATDWKPTSDHDD